MSDRRWWHKFFPATRANVDDLNALLDVTWLQRVWTYQELVLASNPVIVCGDDHISWFLLTSNLVFLEHSGMTYQSFIPKIPTLAAWTNLALTRDRIRNIQFRSTENEAEDDDPLSKLSKATTLHRHVMFMNMIASNYRRLTDFMTKLFNYTIFLLLPVEIIGLVAGFTAASWRGQINYNKYVASKYNGMISSVVKEAIESRFSTGSTIKKAIATLSTATAPSMMITSFSTTTTSSVASPYLGTDVLAIIHRIHGSVDSETTVLQSGISVMRSAIVSGVESCWSSCSSRSDIAKCFGACTSTCSAMPSFRTISTEEADFISHPPIAFFWDSLWLVLAYLGLFPIIGLLWFFVRHVRQMTPMKTNRSFESTLDPVEILCNRKARHDHDKSFALRNILQKLGQKDLAIPDYTISLEKTYAQLNYHLLETTGYGQLVFVASLNRLAGYPCWMPDWSQSIDSFWMEQNLRYNNLTQEYNDLTQQRTGSKLNGWTMENQREMAITGCEYSTVRHLFQFHETSNTGSRQNKICFENFKTSLDLFRAAHQPKGLIDEIKYPGNNSHPLQSFCTSQLINKPRKEVKKWISFLRKSIEQDPKKAFQSLLQEQLLLKIHISICNKFAEGNRQIIWHRSFDHFYFGICTAGAQKGDRLMKVDRVGLHLLVRDVERRKHSYDFYRSYTDMRVQLVSPAVLFGEFKKKEWHGHVMTGHYFKRVKLILP
jgi:hypothetical protein